MQEKLTEAWQKAFYDMEWSGYSEPLIVECNYDNRSENVDSLIDDFVVDFKNKIEGKTGLNFQVEPTLTVLLISPVQYKIVAQYKVW